MDNSLSCSNVVLRSSCESVYSSGSSGRVGSGELDSDSGGNENLITFSLQLEHMKFPGFNLG